MPKNFDPAIFSVIFTKGKATQNRLPLSHVIATLRELDLMIREVGKQIQRSKGVENPTGDFGIELLAGRGLAFHKGSIKARAAVTRDAENGIEAISKVIQTTNIIEKKRPISVDEYGAPVLRRLAAITRVQEVDNTELHLELKPRGKPSKKGKFTESGIQTIKKLSAADFQIDDLTIYGKLRSLSDRSRAEKEDDIWGELVEENGNTWRIKFKPDDLDKARDLFTKQVITVGDASYFKTGLPRLDVSEIREEEPHDYLKGFDNFVSSYEDVFGDADPQDILNELRG
jgi:hypothetical protein